MLNSIHMDGGTSTDEALIEAIDELKLSGICDPVFFNVRDGIYNEQITLLELPGMDAANTVTFQSESGDSSQVILTFSSSLSADNFTLRLDGADWFIFKNLTIEATNPSYGRAVELRNEATNNRFEYCELRGNNANSTSEYHAIVFSPDNDRLDEYNVFLTSI